MLFLMLTSKKAVIYDLDSTIAHTLHRYDLFPEDWSRATRDGWVKYSMACPDDTPIKGTVRRMQMDWPHYQIHIVTGRMAESRNPTGLWLEKHNVPYDYLRMRELEDTEQVKNSDLKIQYIRALQQKGVIVDLAYEDNAVVASLIEKGTGVPVLGVNPFYPSGKEDRFYHKIEDLALS